MNIDIQQFLEPSKINLIFLGLAVASSMVSGCFFWFLMRKNGLAKEIRREIVRMKASAEDFERRLGMLEGHAVDYLLSVGAEGTLELVRLKETLAKVDALANELESLRARGDFHSLGDALSLMSGQYGDFSEEKQEKIKAEFVGPEWENEFESTLQSLGEKVQTASLVREQHQISRMKQKRKSTIATLYDIGVKSAIEQIRAGVPHENISENFSSSESETSKTRH